MTKPKSEVRHGGPLTDRDMEMVARAFGWHSWEDLQKVLRRKPRRTPDLADRRVAI
jgi:hypothetical protein